MKSVCLFVCLLLLGGGFVSSGAQTGAGKPKALAHSTQMIVVTTANWDAAEGRLQRFERARRHGSWRPVGEAIPIVVGKSGLGWGIGLAADDDQSAVAKQDPEKREGDGKSPAGVFDLGTAFGYAAQPLAGLKLPYLTLTPSIECVDDTSSKYYNRIVDRSTVAADWNSSEHMRDVGDSYRWGIVVDHNGTVMGPNRNAPTPGGGSCVFIHIWHSYDQGTAGCTAMAQTNLETLLVWLNPGRKPLLVQLPEAAYERLGKNWKLPKLTAAASAH
jgi:D-alanyl-D-alanine dipeptidase